MISYIVSENIFQLKNFMNFPHQEILHPLEIRKKAISQINIQKIKSFLRIHDTKKIFKFIMNLKIEEVFLYPEFVLLLYFNLKKYPKNELSLFVKFNKKYWEQEFANIYQIETFVLQKLKKNNLFENKDVFFVSEIECLLIIDQFGEYFCNDFIFYKQNSIFQLKNSNSGKLLKDNLTSLNYFEDINKKKFSVLENVDKKGFVMIMFKKNNQENECMTLSQNKTNFIRKIIFEKCNSKNPDQSFKLAKKLILK